MSSSITSAPPKAEWELISTNTLTGVNTFTSSALPVYAAYKVVIIGNGSITDYWKMILNADAAANYFNNYIANITITATTGDSAIYAGTFFAAANIRIEMFIQGKAPTILNGRIGVSSMGSIGSASAAGYLTLINGGWIAGSAVQVSTIKLDTNGGNTFTGKVIIYGQS